jgi:protein involved in polysaccharide export with SLBB domain
MRKEYQIFAVRLVLLTTSWCAIATQRGWFLSPCYATTSEAQQEADLKVSLSAEKIIEILREEPGLLLQVKRMLIQKAYEQGRVLESSDLTDEALFHLLREDDVVRALATRQVEIRFYVRAKRQETGSRRTKLDDDQNQGSGAARPGQKPDSSDQLQTTNSQEEDYSPRGYRDGEDQERSIPKTEAPTRPDLEREISLPRNPARTVNRTELEQNPNIYESMGSEASRMAKSHPQELAGLLSVTAPASAQPLESKSWPRPVPRLPVRSDDSTESGSITDLTEGFPRETEHASLGRYRGATPPISATDELPVIRHRPNPYNDVPSLYDLYSQVSRRSPQLERFGMAVFQNGTGNLDDLPMDLPAGPEYVVGPGDGLNIELWGGVAQRLQRVVDREGRVALPEVGTLQVSGRTMANVQQLVQSVMRTQFRDVEADISLARVRSVQIYVVGDVANPGAYDVSSLSTPLNALYAAGGPTPRGSLRHLLHYRGKRLVQEIDAYDLLLHGVHSELAGIQSGDTILVPPIGREVTVEGMVRRPAIYELGGEKNLAEVLQLAGGVLPSGTLRHMDVERLLAHEKRTMLRLDLPEGNDESAAKLALDKFQVQDGDKIKISPILPYAEKTVFLDGHVFRPGKYPYRDGMRVTDILRDYSDLLPEPSRRHAEIIRLQAPDYTPAVLAFNLGDAMDGNNQALLLKPFDTIRVFSRYDFEDVPVITISGEVRDPGDHVTNGATHLRDAIYLAGGTNPDAELNDAQVFRKTEDGKLKIFSINLGKALTGDAGSNILLQPKDRVFIHRGQSKADLATVMVQGEVIRPGKYPFGENMTAAELVKLAGGFKRGAYTEAADLTRYRVEDGKKLSGEHMTVQIARAMANEPDADLKLHDGDVLSIRQLAGWNDLSAVVTLKGEVVHPGTYGIREGERLSSVLARAGGFRADAYPYGAVLERAQVRQLEEKNRADLIHRVQAEGAGLKLIPETDEEQKMAKQASLMQWQSTLEKLENTEPSGRLVIQISQEIKRWANTSADVQLRAGDLVLIPKAPNFVMVSGAVYNPTAINFRPGKSVGWYLSQGGGATHVADKKAIFLIRANGSVAGGSTGMWSGGVLAAEVRPGDMVVVPEKAYSGTSRWKNTLQVAQLVSAAGIAVQVAKGF